MNSFRCYVTFLCLLTFIGISTAVSQDSIPQKSKERRYFSSHEAYRQFIDTIFALKAAENFINSRTGADYALIGMKTWHASSTRDKYARGIHAPAPKTYLLSFTSSDPLDGFILIDEKTSVKDLSFLTDAPLKNYVTKKLIIPYNLDKRYYFYIRCGKFYGKGVIKNIGARNGAFSHEYSLFVKILFNQKPYDLNLRSL